MSLLIDPGCRPRAHFAFGVPEQEQCCVLCRERLGFGVDSVLLGGFLSGRAGAKVKSRYFWTKVPRWPTTS